MRKRNKKFSLLSVIVVLLAVIGGFLYAKPDTMPGSNVTSADVAVHFIDIGQGDAQLILLPEGKTMLIDAGDNGREDTLLSYLQSAGVSRIDYLVGTHPHADHIGGMLEVVENFPIGKIFMPRVTHTSKTYADLLTAIDQKGLSIETARQGKVLLEENGVYAEFLAPCSDTYAELNDYSAVIRLSYQDISFLFTGDAEALSEAEMLANNQTVAADVLKVGHHGSSTSTDSAFLQAVSPSYAVISCGMDNSYGHPHEETMQKLEKSGAEVLRTDEMGTIIMEIDGENLSVRKER